jgi:hypothetical protein
VSMPLMPGQVQYLAGYDRPIASVARYIMQVIEKTFDDYGIELPERRVIAIGSVAVDAPLVAVMFGGVAVGAPGNELNAPLRGDSPRSLTFNVELWRQTPAIGPSGLAPTATEITTSAEAIMNDSWLLLEAAYASDQLGVGVIANVTVNEPQGEMSGVSMAVELQVP